MSPEIEFFICSLCHGSFRKGVSDAEAYAEALVEGHAPVDRDDEALLCDDCYGPFLQWMRHGRTTDA
jgi:hypothetical protein